MTVKDTTSAAGPALAGRVAVGVSARPAGVRPTARRLAEHFCPDTGVPLRLGRVWPPRPMVHGLCAKGAGDTEVRPAIWVQHALRGPVSVQVRRRGRLSELADSSTLAGVDVIGAEATEVPPGRWVALTLVVRWGDAARVALRAHPWGRLDLEIVLSDGHDERTFRSYLYVTPDAPELPLHASSYDDHPHYRWVDAEGGPLRVSGVANAWIELPAPMSSPLLSPACWVQPRSGARAPGPEGTEVLALFPLEPPLSMGDEVVGWNGALGGSDRRPMLLPLAVRSEGDHVGWRAPMEYWDTDRGELSAPHRLVQAVVLEPPTECRWPRLVSPGETPIECWLLRDEDSCEVKVDVPVRLAEDCEPMQVRRADVRLGDRIIGRWEGPAQELYTGRTFQIPVIVDLASLAREAGDRLKLTLDFEGEPRRGVYDGNPRFRSEGGPWVRVSRARGRDVRSPWLVLDLGTEGTCAAVSFLDGFAPRVVHLHFADGPIYPSRVYVVPGYDGTWTLADAPEEGALYTTGIKLGLRFGDGAHPGCPDHVSAIEVAKYFLRRFLLEVRERAAWFPLEDADVLVSFPPRLAVLPRFVRSLREVFEEVVAEVIWPEGKPRRVMYREEAFLVAMPALAKDLELAPLPPSGARFYWVIDFGGGTTDVCGFLCANDAWGEEHTLSQLTYPQRFPYHVAGNDVTLAFYQALRAHMVALGLVVGEGEEVLARSFVIPHDPFPTTRASPVALLNQTALRELADLIKSTPSEALDHVTVRELARRSPTPSMRTATDVATTLVAVLSSDAATLGERSARSLHGEVLGVDPLTWGDYISDSLAPVATGGPVDREDTRKVACRFCQEEHAVPTWMLTGEHTFRFRCRACGKTQQVQSAVDAVAPVVSDTVPVLLAQQPVPPDARLLLDQAGQVYHVSGVDTLVRWVTERRAAPTDRVSTDGTVWETVRDLLDRAGVALAFEEPGPLEVYEEPVEQVGRPVGPPAGVPGDLYDRIGRFLDACREGLDDARARLPEAARDADVVVLLAGRASQFAAIPRLAAERFQGRVVHLTHDWVRRAYGRSGVIDPSAGLKTLTVNGGGLFALNQSNPDISPLVLSFDTGIVDCRTWIRVGAADPWLATESLDLRPGETVALRRDGLVGGAEDAPLTGRVDLLVEGLPEDRDMEPWVTVATGVARRVDGKRLLLGAAPRLRTEADAFVLESLAAGGSIRLARQLPLLPLLGESAARAGEAPLDVK